MERLEANSLMWELFRVKPTAAALGAWFKQAAPATAPDAALNDLWTATSRADVMLALVNGFADRKVLTRLACDGARMVQHLVPDDEHRPRLAIDTAERWLAGSGTLEEVELAARAALAAGEDVHRKGDFLSPAVGACEAAGYAAATAVGPVLERDGGALLTAANVGQALRSSVAEAARRTWRTTHPTVRTGPTRGVVAVPAAAPPDDPEMQAYVTAEVAKVMEALSAAIRAAMASPSVKQLVEKRRRR